ncbi:MAG: hypothetical protein ACRD2L_03830, partial [Terriglobia bacterium]
MRLQPSSLCFLFLLCATPAAGQVNTAKSQWFTAPKTGGNCTNESCGAGSCCNCTTIRVHLPLGANVKEVRYYIKREEDGQPAQV